MTDKMSFPIPALGMFEKELSQVKNYTFLSKLKTWFGWAVTSSDQGILVARIIIMIFIQTLANSEIVRKFN